MIREMMMRSVMQKSWRRLLMKGGLLVFLFSLPAFIQRCGRQPNASTLTMVNGFQPGPEHPASWSAVALVDRSTRKHFCSATLIAENMLVTAAHCVFDKRPDEFLVMFGPDTSAADAIYRKVLKRETYKKGQKYESNFDIAWVQFEGPVPEGKAPIEIWHQPGYLQAGMPLMIAGYGRTASQCDYDNALCQGGKLLSVETSVREFVNHGRLVNLLVIGPRPGYGPCFGDSGGPAFVQKDGRWYLVGDFMGWDRILVPEQMETICDTGEAIYNYVGDFVSWIEASSGQSLAYQPNENPRQPPLVLDTLSEEPASFAAWCQYDNHEDPAWFTVQRILRLVSDWAISEGKIAMSRAVYEDCQLAEESLAAMLQKQSRLEIPGFDPEHFIDSAKLEDVRPLASLASLGLRELILTDHAIADLSPILALRQLEHLEILDNVSPLKKVQPSKALSFSNLSQLKVLRLQNAGLTLIGESLAGLTRLENLELSYLTIQGALSIQAKTLKTLRLEAPEGLLDFALPELPLLEELVLNRLRVKGSWPSELASLRSLELLEVSGLKEWPTHWPELRRLFLYASDLSPTLRFAKAPHLEELSLIGNAQLTQIDLKPGSLPALQYLEIVENPLTAGLRLQDLPLLSTALLLRNALPSLPSFRDLPQLARLDLEGNQIKSLEGLQKLPRLEYINLSQNPLKTLDGLSDLPQLKRLVAQNEKGQGLESLGKLSGLPKMEEWNLARNALVDAKEFLAFPSLEALILSDNLLEEYAFLGQLPKLSYLELVNNPLRSQHCPLSPPKFCRFEWMNISGNGPIDFRDPLRNKGDSPFRMPRPSS